ncbi:MAG: hypothetical protein LLF96_02480 [Eubacteriales bacterium]|nr:hypothetical protein [Eubacteriales bacterium]
MNTEAIAARLAKSVNIKSLLSIVIISETQPRNKCNFDRLFHGKTPLLLAQLKSVNRKKIGDVIIFQAAAVYPAPFQQNHRNSVFFGEAVNVFREVRLAGVAFRSGNASAANKKYLYG